MRIVFCGTPEYSVPSLKRLAGLAPKHSVVGVVSQPDKAKGRSKIPTPPPVVAAARELGIPDASIFQPCSINRASVIAALKALQPDLLCVVAYGNLLKKDALELARLPPINAHASLLPRYRGAAPIQAALLSGDAETGVCVMKMEAGLDTGPVMLARKLPILSGDDAGTLHDKLAELSAQCFVEAIDRLDVGQAIFMPQDEAQASYAPKLHKDSGHVDWSGDAHYLERFVRAMSPWPGAWTKVATAQGEQSKRVRIVKASVQEWTSPSAGRGHVSPDGSFVVECGCGALAIQVLQPEGKREMSAAEFIRGAGRGYIPESRWG